MWPIPWSVIWAFIPKKYFLIAGAALAALCVIWGAIALYGSHRETVGYNAGWNHAVVLETQKQVVVVDSLERRADSIAAIARKADDRLSLVRDSTDTKLRHAVRIGRIVPLAADSLVPTVPLSQLVAIYFTSDSVQTPHYADLAVAQLAAFQDSVIYRVLIPQRDSAVVIALAWKRAWGSEHDARIGADSLSALWRTRALNIPAAPKASHRTQVAFATLGIVAGVVLAKHVHIKL